MFVFALFLDYCVFVALLNRLAIQQLHLDPGTPNFFWGFWDETAAKSYLPSVAALAHMQNKSHACMHAHRQAYEYCTWRTYLSTSTSVHALSDES